MASAGEEDKAGGDKATIDELQIKDDYTSSLFQCCVCLDLQYKPIVLSCGHISCFWCVHRAMQSEQESHCAICRQPFQHFPSICPLLHNLLLKLEPVAYKRREEEVIEEEKHLRIQSPQFVDEVPLPSSGPTDDSGGGSTNSDLQQTMENGCTDGLPKKIAVEDALCSLCNELLYLPSVLNCGHVYCEACLKSMAGERLECKVCGAPHPGQFPNVCLDLDHLLEESFPEEYASRRQAALVYKSQLQHGDTSSSSSSAQGDGNSKKKDIRSLLGDVKSNVHVGVGCDYCGLYPIKGKRYKCIDCKEKIGFDLCESCYSTKSKLPGRFNQQHTSDHRFKEYNSNLVARILLQGVAFENYEEDIYEDEYADEDGGGGGGNGFNPDRFEEL